MANLAFDANQVDPTDQFEVLPAGDYPVMIVDSEMKPTKDNRGQYLQLTLEVIDGPCRGRKMWDRLNLQNPNQQAVEIAQRSLSQICHAVGVLQVNDSAELHDKPMVARVKVRPARGQYPESNEVSQYKPAGPAPANRVSANQPAANQPPQQPSSYAQGSPYGGGGAAQPNPAAMPSQQPPQQQPTPQGGGASNSVPPWQR